MIFSRLIDRIRRVIKSMFSKSQIEKSIQKDIVVSKEMALRIDLWSKMYENKAPWIKDDVKSCGLPAAIAKEMARLVTVEFESEITGNDFLNKEYQVFLKNLRKNVEFAAAKGGIVFKPYVDGNHIEIDIVQGDRFFPVKFNSRNEVLGAVFPESITSGKYTYTRVEYHELTENGYVIQNKAYKKNTEDTSDSLGKEIPLTSIEEWSELEPNVLIKNIDTPLFVYLRMPDANNIDASSPLGVSVYDRAREDIENADKQWSRIMWEYEGSELAIDADVSMFKKDEVSNKFVLPSGKERLFRILDFDDNKEKYKVFAPEIRDISLFNGFNNILKRIEFNSGLAYGTLSDPQNVDKTAEEIKSSKQRSYSTVKDIQNATEDALESLAQAMDIVARLGNLPGGKEYEMNFKWDDSIVVDREKELLSMQQDAVSGMIRKELYIAKKYGVTEEEALKMMPAQPKGFPDDE